MVSATPCVGSNTLERYVALPDPSYGWKATAALPGKGYTTHLLELVSQRWRDESQVDRPRWQHQLRLVVPDQTASDTALLVIAGGSNNKPAPAHANPLLAIAAMMTRSVAAELRIIPNQPLTFAGETDARAEDGIIAYSWDKYLRTGDESWPLRLPMTKSV
ncbi:MAG TPA: PhoPQ-activated protein PqaA family protein, partial [Stellaceae bacterium]|nr:PhoPQ-activated protein PqaA family protein [Stellaceae bacterium]